MIAGKQSRRYWEAACTIAACLVLAIPAAHAQAKNPAAAQSQPAAADSALTSKIMADAEAALKQGNTRLALIHLRNAVQAAPADAAIRMRLGVILFQSGNTAAAEHELRQARQYGAPAELVLPVLFQSMISRGEFQLILDQFPDPAASTQPAAADIFAARALALRHLGRLPEAIDAMERSLKVRRDARGLLSRARLALQEGQVTPALALADEAVAKFPREPEPLVFKSQLLLNSGNSAAALKVADELGARFPDSRTARLARVELFLGTQNDAKADAEIRAILAKNSRDGMATYYSALLRARKQDIKGAWAIAQTVPTALFDDWPNMGILVAQMAERAGRLETSASILSRILSKNPDLLEIRLKLADIRIQQNSSEFALRILTPVKNSTDPQVLKRLKQVYYDLDRRDDEAAIDKKIKQGTQISGPSALASSQVIRTDAVIANLGGIAERDSTNPAYVVPYIKALIQMKRFDRALAAAERLGAAAPQRSNAQVYRGNVFLAQGKPADALVAFNQAVAVDSRNVMALTARAGFFTTQKRLPEARRDLAAILAIDPKDEGALLRSAEISSLLGEDQAVRETLLRAISFRPNSEAPRLALLRYLVTKKDFSQAIVQADAFVATHPNSSDGLALLGQAQAALGRKKEAVATFRRLIGVKPNEAVPQVLLASALVSTGNNDAAWGALEAAMKLDPKSGSTRAAAIGLQLSQGKNDRAMSIAREFRRSNPGPGADILLADTMVKVGQVKDADTILSKSFADYPNNATLLSLMKFSFLSNDPKRADRLGAKWLADHPGDGHVRLQYAMALMQTGQNANAISQYETVLKAEPQNTIAMNNLGWLLQTSDPKRAVSLLSLAWKLSPDSAEIADTLGWIKLHQNDARGALELLNKAHALRPQEGEITYHLALALDANGKRDEARKLLDGLLASGVAFQGRSAAHTLSAGWR